jgi:hypothetical protein
MQHCSSTSSTPYLGGWASMAAAVSRQTSVPRCHGMHEYFPLTFMLPSHDIMKESIREKVTICIIQSLGRRVGPSGLCWTKDIKQKRILFFTWKANYFLLLGFA